MQFELRARCPKCKTERSIWCETCNPQIAASMDAMERRIDQVGHVDAHCPTCDTVEDVALFVDGKQTEPWQNADKYELKNGPNAGPLPPEPWRKIRDN